MREENLFNQIESFRQQIYIIALYILCQIKKDYGFNHSPYKRQDISYIISCTKWCSNGVVGCSKQPQKPHFMRFTYQAASLWGTKAHLLLQVNR